MKLIKYDAACRAIAVAKRVDEVKHIRDVSIAMKAYARRANNHEMEADPIEIRMRAARRLDVDPRWRERPKTRRCTESKESPGRAGASKGRKDEKGPEGLS